MRLPILLFCLVVLNGPGGQAGPPPQPLQTPADLVARIPFIYDGVHVIIRATLDNYREQLNFIFDTGAEVNILNEKWKKYFKLTIPGEGDLSGSGAGMKVLPLTDIKAFHIGKGTLFNQQFYLEDLHDLNTRGQRIDGIIGYHLLASYIVKIDFDDHVIDLYRTGRFDYGPDGLLVKMRMNNYTPVIRAGVAISEGDTLTGWYNITTGGDYGVLFNYPYVEKYHLVTPDVLTGRDSVNDLLVNRQFTDFEIPAFMIGNHLLEHVDASFCPDVNDNDPTRDIAGAIGNDVFKHFNITLNYGEREIFLEPNGRK